MGVRVTDAKHVALYDSVSGIAFGPTFDSDLDAEAFLDWLADNEVGDARALSETVLNAAAARFETERLND